MAQAPTPAGTHAARRDRLRALLADAGADALLVTDLVNVRYLCGFTGSNAALLVLADREGAVLATDGRYTEQAAREAPDIERVRERAVATVLAERAAAEGVRRLAVEEHRVTVEQHRTIGDAYGADGGAGGGELTDGQRAVERLRAVKDEHEIDLLRTACAISVQALEVMTRTPALGATERQLARRLEALMLDLGADGIAFATIVATGPHSAVPHHRPTDRTVAAGDLLKIDFGARMGGYHADCTRSFVVGAQPQAWQREIHAAVLAGQLAGRTALAPGADARDIDHAARSVIEDAGYGEAFPHGLGHGVGLEIHEAPLLGYGSEARLAARTPVTVEPGIYLSGRGGVRIEDTLVVRDPADPAGPAGGTELLTVITRELLVLT